MSEAPAEKLHGRCQCGRIVYEVTPPIDHVTSCHCGMCRKAHGAAFATYATVKHAQFRFTQGSEFLKAYASSPTVKRSFCSECGTQLLWGDETRFPGNTSFTLATLDSAFEPAAPIRNIFMEDAACWDPVRQA